MKIILFLFCVAILSCTDNRADMDNEDMQTMPVAADSTPDNPVPIDQTMHGDTTKAMDSIGQPGN